MQEVTKKAQLALLAELEIRGWGLGIRDQKHTRQKCCIYFVKIILTGACALENTLFNLVNFNEFRFHVNSHEINTDPALIDAIEIRDICQYYDDAGIL